MKITFLGTGEAFGSKANTSILIDDMILLDCGLHTVRQLMKINFALPNIKLIWISHLHADHYFGLPAFLCACMEDRRGVEIEIVGCRKTKEYVEKLLYLAYRKRVNDFNFSITFNEILEDTIFEFEDYTFEFAPTAHSVDNFAVSITDKEGKKVVYTSDGAATDEVTGIAKNADLVIAEAYLGDISGHSSITDAIKSFTETNAKKLALVHICRKENIGAFELKDINGVFIPDDLEVLEI